MPPRAPDSERIAQLEQRCSRLERANAQQTFALVKTVAWRPENNGQEEAAAIWAEQHRLEVAERRAAEIEGERERAKAATA
jgi:hypothetical protein